MRLIFSITQLARTQTARSEYQPFRFLGRKLELEEWRSTPANAQYVEALTAIGPFAKVDSLDNEKALLLVFIPTVAVSLDSTIRNLKMQLRRLACNMMSLVGTAIVKKIVLPNF
jgi:uncharacterized protein YqcC (DUF446 family)